MRLRIEFGVHLPFSAILSQASSLDALFAAPTEGGYPAANNTTASRCSPLLETPPDFPPLSSSPPLQPIAVDPSVVGGGDTGGAAAGGYAGALQPLPRWPLFWEQQQPSVPLPGSAARGSGGAVSGGPALGGAGGSVVKDPTFEFAAASALVAELVDFATTCRLDYVTSLLSCLAAAVPHLAAMLIAAEGDSDVPDILTPRSYVEAITGPYSSQWQTAMEAEMASSKFTGACVDAVPPSGGVAAACVNGSCELAPSLLGRSRLRCRVCGEHNRPAAVGDAVLGAWTQTWASGRSPGRLDADLGAWTPTWQDADLVASTWLPSRLSYPSDGHCGRYLRFSSVLVTMVGPVGDASVVDTLETRLSDAMRRHADGEYGETFPLEVVKLGIRTKWATEHPSRPASPRPVNNEGGVDTGINAGDQVRSCAGGTSRIPVTAPLVGRHDLLTWKESINPQLEMTGLMCFADGTVETLPESNAELRAEFRVVQLLTFTVISRYCSPVVQIALKSCRHHMDVGHRAWQFVTSTYQVTDDLYIGQLEELISRLRMGEQETTTDYCNRAWHLLTCMRVTTIEYSTASYITNVINGLPSGYNLMKQLMVVPGTREFLNEDLLTSYILRD
ncbi:unnamed protein product [Closterium sp. NIES-54]